jgi:hypothetical protein
VSHLWRSRCSPETSQLRPAKNHRTVRWCTGLSGGAPDCPVSQWSGAPTVGWGHQTVRCAPDSVRCANGSKSSTVGCAKLGKQSAPDTVPVRWCTGLSGAPPDRRQDLPSWIASTAPSCLGAIKGTPRRMEEYTKHSLINSKHQDSISAHLILCDSN